MANPEKKTELEEVSKLLGRLPIRVNEDLIRNDVTDRTVLVTGAGGTIGGALSRRLLSMGVGRLVLLDHSEHALFWVNHELSEMEPNGISIEPVLASIRDRQVIEHLLRASRPDIVFHAAAYKHVEMVESNRLAGICTNVLGTHWLLESCCDAGVDRFLLISSDKAVNPTSLMGATKRCAELLTCASAKDGSRYSSVRFGNVLGSSGSVARIFEKRIAEGKHLEVRHRDAVRFFMSIEEAGRLLLLVSSMTTGGEIFVLETGTGVRILDLARRLVAGAGKAVRMPGDSHAGIEVKFTKLKSGEKVLEELSGAAGNQLTQHPNVKRVYEEALDYGAMISLIADLEVACSKLKPEVATQILSDIMELGGASSGLVADAS